MRLAQLRRRIQEEKLVDEHGLVNKLMFEKSLSPGSREQVTTCARDLVEFCRADSQGKGTLDSFLLEFGLSNNEGVGLMCLAEALLRVPDALTADRLIAEKISSGDWASHSGNSESLFVNASTWGLMLTGHLVHLDTSITEKPGSWIKGLTAKLGEPLVRTAVLQAMKIMGGQYVLGRDIKEGIRRGVKENTQSTRFSFDMLGEAARTEKDAQRYFKSYANAIETIGALDRSSSVYDANGISVKLSALHCRYHYSHQEAVMAELYPRIKALCVSARKYNIGLSIDAEEAARLDISLEIFERLAKSKELANWDGLGFVLQAYQKRSPLVAKWLIELGKAAGRRLMVRLVKGAYWDAEIKHAQEQGHTDYPVFTRKANTDLCYVSCAKILFSAQNEIYPQFATHNAYTAAYVIELAKGEGGVRKEFEFQRLHGMGHLLYKHLMTMLPEQNISLRVYAPIGEHQDLLPYLVRRLLENGANSSFVNRFLDKDMPSNQLIQDVYEQVTEVFPYRHSAIVLPKNIFEAFGESRTNAKGIDLDSGLDISKLNEKITEVCAEYYEAGSIVNGAVCGENPRQIDNPSKLSEPVGSVLEATVESIDQALAAASASQVNWQETSASERANILNRMALNLEANMSELIGLVSLEAGRTIPDGVSEVREAVDFCRYYALQAERVLNEKSGLRACGTFFCVSPWNFPLAIFVGQIAAALAAGNTVIAKPAEQTPLVANRAVQLFHKAGVPVGALNLLTGRGATIGSKVLSDPRIQGVCFTGSTETAQVINRQLAARPGHAIPFIAETGGQNCMVVDSTALPEQVVDDVIASAFMSAGQRCSALRVLFIQQDIADKVLEMLKGAMQSVVLGHPAHLSTDVGPVIDEKARLVLRAHSEKMEQEAKTVASIALDKHLDDGCYFPPKVFEIEHISLLEREVFGPILHVIRFSADKLDDVIAQINSTGYGLTLGVHSRIEAFANYIFRKTQVGNTYINRNTVGAVVGVNPFGGNNLSGTGPKAGGPNYLYRFCRPDLPVIASPSYSAQQRLKKENVLSDRQIVALGRANDALMRIRQTSPEHRVAALSHPLVSRSLGQGTERYANTLCELMVENNCQPVLLPGPTGEENVLLTMGKGVVLCVASEADSIDQVALQVAVAIAAGCSVIIAGDHQNKTDLQAVQRAFQFESMPEHSVQVIEDENLEKLVCHEHIVAVTLSSNHPTLSEIKQVLASREGAIVPLVEFGSELQPSQKGALYSLLTYMIMEKTRTENMVARGGNTQLFNLEE